MTYDFDTPIDRTGTYSMKWEEAGDALPMWVADMDFTTAPEIRAALQRRLDHGVFGYSVAPPEWNRAYVDWWGARHGLAIDPDSLVFCTGVVPAISSMVRKLTTPNENVLIQTPVYNIFFNSIVNNGCRVLESPLRYDGAGSYAIDWADLEAKLADPQTTLMILCNPHNPVGRIWERDTLARIGDLCQAHHVTVISDEIHCDLTDPGYDYVPFASVNERCAMNSVTCMAPTKAFNIAGLQTAAVMIPNPVLRHKVWRALNTDEVAEPNAFAMDATIAAFNEGGPWLDELRAYIAGNKAAARAMIDEYNVTAAADRRIIMTVDHATYLLWVDCSAISDNTDKLCDYLTRECKVMFSEGSEYGGDGRRFVRINVACPRSRMTEGLTRFLDGLRKYR